MGDKNTNTSGLIRPKFTSDAKVEKEVKEILKVEIERRKEWVVRNGKSRKKCRTGESAETPDDLSHIHI